MEDVEIPRWLSCSTALISIEQRQQFTVVERSAHIGEGAAVTHLDVGKLGPVLAGVLAQPLLQRDLGGFGDRGHGPIVAPGGSPRTWGRLVGHALAPSS